MILQEKEMEMNGFKNELNEMSRRMQTNDIKFRELEFLIFDFVDSMQQKSQKNEFILGGKKQDKNDTSLISVKQVRFDNSNYRSSGLTHQSGSGKKTKQEAIDFSITLKSIQKSYEVLVSENKKLNARVQECQIELSEKNTKIENLSKVQKQTTRDSETLAHDLKLLTTDSFQFKQKLNELFENCFEKLQQKSKNLISLKNDEISKINESEFEKNQTTENQIKFPINESIKLNSSQFDKKKRTLNEDKLMIQDFGNMSSNHPEKTHVSITKTYTSKNPSVNDLEISLTHPDNRNSLFNKVEGKWKLSDKQAFVPFYFERIEKLIKETAKIESQNNELEIKKTKNTTKRKLDIRAFCIEIISNPKYTIPKHMKSEFLIQNVTSKCFHNIENMTNKSPKNLRANNLSKMEHFKLNHIKRDSVQFIQAGEFSDLISPVLAPADFRAKFEELNLEGISERLDDIKEEREDEEDFDTRYNDLKDVSEQHAKKYYQLQEKHLELEDHREEMETLLQQANDENSDLKIKLKKYKQKSAKLIDKCFRNTEELKKLRQFKYDTDMKFGQGKNNLFYENTQKQDQKETEKLESAETERYKFMEEKKFIKEEYEKYRKRAENNQKIFMIEMGHLNTLKEQFQILLLKNKG